jgi:hypothetical protein
MYKKAIKTAPVKEKLSSLTQKRMKKIEKLD